MAISLVGCGGGITSAELEVVVTTDFLPLTEFVRVDASLVGPGETPSWNVVVLPSDNYVAGHSVAEWSGIPTGDYELSVTLIAADGTAVANRRQSVQVRGSMTVRVPISRSVAPQPDGAVPLPDGSTPLPDSGLGDTGTPPSPDAATGPCGGADCTALDTECQVGVCISNSCVAQARGTCTPCSAGFCIAGACQADGTIPTMEFGFDAGGVPTGWESIGDAPWRTVPEARTGARAMRSGTIGNDEVSILRAFIHIPTPSTVEYYVRTSTQESDLLTFELDYPGGGGRAMIGGMANSWDKQEIRMSGSGMTTLTWTYAKDGSGAQGEDAVWIDDVRIIPIMASCE